MPTDYSKNNYSFLPVVGSADSVDNLLMTHGNLNSLESRHRWHARNGIQEWVVSCGTGMCHQRIRMGAGYPTRPCPLPTQRSDRLTLLWTVSV